MLVRAADPTIDGGLVIAVEHEWTYEPSWAPPYETRRLKALRDDPVKREPLIVAAHMATNLYGKAPSVTLTNLSAPTHTTTLMDS